MQYMRWSLCGCNIVAVNRWESARIGLDRTSTAATVGEISLCCVQRRRWAADKDPAVGKNNRQMQCKVGEISSLLVQYHCRSSVGRWSYGAATAAMVGAISLVLCVVILVVTTVPPKIQSAPPPISRIGW
jgi:hypothetical protein